MEKAKWLPLIKDFSIESFLSCLATLPAHHIFLNSNSKGSNRIDQC